MTRSPFSVPLVCECSRFVGLGDGQGFIEKLQIFISLMEFNSTLFHCVKQIFPRFLRKLSFDTKLAEKPNFSDFEMISGFY